MSRFIPIRDLAGKIVSFRDEEDPDPVQATLEASLKAVGATPIPEPSSSTKGQQTVQRPSWGMIALSVAVLSIGILYLTLLPAHRGVPSRIASVPTTPPTTLPSPTTLPTTLPRLNPNEVILSPVALYGDYDESTRLGLAPDGLICSFSGQSPDGVWVYLACPEPTGHVWAKVSTLALSETQHAALGAVGIVSHAAPTAAVVSAPQAVSAQRQVFCADRQSIYGSTHQCADSQAAADALADRVIGAINTAAQRASSTQLPSTVTPTPSPQVVAFKESFQPQPECNIFIGYVGEKRTHCDAVYATQTAQATNP
jgi:hypothetical protein